jgi:hypothetical protein
MFIIIIIMKFSNLIRANHNNCITILLKNNFIDGLCKLLASPFTSPVVVFNLFIYLYF